MEAARCPGFLHWDEEPSLPPLAPLIRVTTRARTHNRGSGSDPGGKEAERRRGYLREGGGRWIYLEHFSLTRLLVCVLLTALLTVVLALPLGPDFRGPPLELPAALSTLG